MADRPEGRPGPGDQHVDPEARHTRKSKSKRRDGFRGHLAAEPQTGLITDCEMTAAAGPGGSDAENGVKMACRDRFHGCAEGGDDAASAGEGTVPGASQPEEPGDQEREDGLEMYGDSAYGSGEARAAYQAAGHDTVIKPKPVQPAVPGGFTLDDFTICEQDGTITCPAGHTRPMSGKRTSPSAHCAATARCGRGAPPPETAGLCHPPAEGLLRTARRRPARRSSGRPTGPVDDRTGHRLDRHQNGRRIRLRYIGTVKNDAWLDGGWAP